MDKLINPIYNKNVNDYDDKFEICIQAFNGDNLNRKSKFVSNLILELYVLCVTQVNKNMCLTYQVVYLNAKI